MFLEAAAVCFFGFFRAEEIALCTMTSFDIAQHLAWGNMVVSCSENRQMLIVLLKKLKMN